MNVRKMRNRRVTKLGEMVYLARNKAGLTLRTLEARSGVSFTSLVDIELGARKNPSVTSIAKIVLALDMDPAGVLCAVLEDERNNKRAAS